MIRVASSAKEIRGTSDEDGISMIEVMVSIVLIGILASGITSSLQTSLRVAKKTEVHYAASSLAASRVEDLAAIDIGDVDSSLNEVGTQVNWPGLNLDFFRTTTVTINADDSRTIDVTVSCTHATVPTTVDFSTTFARWE